VAASHTACYYYYYYYYFLPSVSIPEGGLKIIIIIIMILIPIVATIIIIIILNSKLQQTHAEYDNKGKKLCLLVQTLKRRTFNMTYRSHYRLSLTTATMSVNDWPMNAIVVMYDDAQTVVKAAQGDSTNLRREHGATSGSALSLLVFVI